jgi:pilus assembly protein CpaB
LGITQVLAKRGDPSASGDLTPVYVARDDIATGSLITQDNAKVEQWPKDRVPTGAVVRLEDIDGRRARQKIYAGEPMIEPKLLGRGQVPTDSLVPKGLRVVPVPVGLEAIHSGLVLPGSRCDVQVFIRADPNLGIGETLCKTVLQDIRVFAVNDVTSTESLDPKAPDTRSIPTGRTVSLLVTPAQAQIVTLASQLGTIRLILRSGEDSEQPKTIVMTAHELLGAFGGSDRGKENPMEANEKRFLEWAEMIKKTLQKNAKAESAGNRAREEEQRFTMRVRTGAEVNDVLLINNSGVQGLPGDEGAWTATGMGPSVRTKANVETHGPRPVDAGPAGPATPPKGGANTLPVPTSPGSPRSPDGPYTSPVSPQSPNG